MKKIIESTSNISFTKQRITKGEGKNPTSTLLLLLTSKKKNNQHTHMAIKSTNYTTLYVHIYIQGVPKKERHFKHTYKI